MEYVHHRQDTIVVNAPPIIGPVASPSWPIPTFSPMKSASFFVGRMAEKIVTAPFASPAEPIPAIALPTMNMADELAAPHMADPTSKMIKKVIKVHCVIDMLDLFWRSSADGAVTLDRPLWKICCISCRSRSETLHSQAGRHLHT